MASHRRRKQSKSSKCSKPINTLIDLAAAATFDYIASKRRQKHGVSHTKIDPYAAAGVAFGMGNLKSTEDVLKLGGMLGSMGAFDDTDDLREIMPGASIGTMGTVIDAGTRKDIGLQYGILRENYESREDYVAALNEAYLSDSCIGHEDAVLIEDEDDFEDELVLCCVSCLDSGINATYHSYDTTLAPGDLVYVPKESGGKTKGVILTVEQLDGIKASDACHETPEIIDRVHE